VHIKGGQPQLPKKKIENIDETTLERYKRLFNSGTFDICLRIKADYIEISLEHPITNKSREGQRQEQHTLHTEGCPAS
jgi:hypothetical protein